MAQSPPNKDKQHTQDAAASLMKQNPITEVMTNTFVINLQQAIFDLETGRTNSTVPATSMPLQTPSQLRHFLTGQELSTAELHYVLDLAQSMKQNPAQYQQVLAQRSLVMLFEKPSFRTRLSFAMAMQSLGGSSIESISHSRKQETPADMARVLNGYADFVMLRTHDEQVLQELALHSTVPVINGLSSLHHPCQVLADLLSLQEHFGRLAGLTLAYVGDGNNVLHSLLLLAPQLGVHIHYCCPEKRQPNELIVQQARETHDERIAGFNSPQEAVQQANAVYTDVWTSMGFEGQVDPKCFAGFQVNEALMALAKDQAVFMHCMPMERGQEVSQALPDSPASIIFRQSENRLHVQKALLCFLAGVYL